MGILKDFGTARKAAGNAQLARMDTLSSHTKFVDDSKVENFGSVGNGFGVNFTLGMPTSFSFTIANASGGTLTYVLGDPQGLYAAMSGATLTALTSTSAGTVAALNASFVNAPAIIKGFNVSATSGAAQFGQLTRFAMADTDGRNGAIPINMSEFQRPTFQNANLLTFQLANPLKLTWNTALLFTVLNGQTLNVTALLGAVVNRI